MFNPFKAVGRFARTTWYDLFHLTVKRKVRTFMLCWTGFFSVYEVAMMFVTSMPLFHFVFLLLQATYFVAYLRAKAV